MRMTKQLEQDPIARMFRREINFVRKNMPKGFRWPEVRIKIGGFFNSRVSIFSLMETPETAKDNGTYVTAWSSAAKNRKPRVEVELHNRVPLISFEYFGQHSIVGQTISEAMVTILAHELYHHWQDVNHHPVAKADRAFCVKHRMIDPELRGALERPAVVASNMVLLKWRGSKESKVLNKAPKEFEEKVARETVVEEDFTSPLKTDAEVKTKEDRELLGQLTAWEQFESIVKGGTGWVYDKSKIVGF